MTKKVAYKYRLEPSKEQRIQFAKTFGCVRKVYNLMLGDRIDNYEAVKNGEATEYFYPTPAQYKADYPFLKEVDSLALANAQVNLNRAYQNFFRDKSVGFPRFKSKKYSRKSYTTNNQKGSVRLIDNRYVKLPKVKEPVRIKLHREPQGVIKSATISQTATGQYYISLLCEQETSALPETNQSVGIDLGVTTFAVLSDGRKMDNQRFTAQMERKLEREQRKLSRRALIAKKKGVKLSEAKNYQKQKRVVAHLHQKVANQRKDFLHKLSKQLVEEFDILCVEDLHTKGLLRNQKLAKAISDVSWSEFVRMIEYKADWYGRTVIKVDRWFPSSQLCSTCGHQDGKKPLDVREWTCSSCHSHHDRDVNASVNILNEGLRQHHKLVT